jgi:hypothetical protein
VERAVEVELAGVVELADGVLWPAQACRIAAAASAATAVTNRREHTGQP